MPLDGLNKIREYENVDVATFHDDIVASARPAVLRNAIADWPAVKLALRSQASLIDRLKSFDTGANVALVVAPASTRGRLFYNEQLTGLNFERHTVAFATALDRIAATCLHADAPTLAIQSAAIASHIPGFVAEHKPSVLSDAVKPHIWIGNRVTVATHYDQADNLACVVAGRRRFTLFPPEQVANLYVGPLEFTPAGAPVSMVSLHTPDFAKYPRFEHALAAAEQAELGPGDAIYIPYFWWHHVDSLEGFNVLVNYWWNSARPGMGKPFDVLLHAILTLRELPPSQRNVWRAVFDHYVFQTGGDPAAHLPPHARGVLATLTIEQRQQIAAILMQAFSRPR